MVKVLVTGVAGFIGMHTALALLERGDEIVGIDNLNDYYDVELKKRRLLQIEHENFTFIEADCSNREQMEIVFSEHKFDKVCHLAAQAGVRYSLENPYSYEEWNNLGFLTVLEMCRHHGVKDVVFASSSSVYGGRTNVPFKETDSVDKPISTYAATKKYNEVLAHTYHHLFGLNCTGLRFFTVYGEWGRPDMALWLFTQQIFDGEEVRVFNNGEQQRDFTHVDDVVKGVLLALDKPFGYEIFNLGHGKPIGLLEFIKLIEEKSGLKAKLLMEPAQPGDVKITYADVSKAKQMLGYSPMVSPQEGVEDFVEWYRKYRETF